MPYGAMLAGLPTTISLLYLDDILVPGCSFDQHITNLRKVYISMLVEGKFKAEPQEMCPVPEGSEVSWSHCECHRVAPDPAKIEAVKTWPRPSHIKDV